MIDSLTRPRPRCAACRSDGVLPVVSGFPAPELEALASRGEVVLGGCKVTPATPRWHCTVCGANFGSQAERRCDEVVIDACANVASDLGPRQFGRPEAQLQDAVANAVGQAAGMTGNPDVDVRTGRLKLVSGWSPLPGPIDVHVADAGRCQLDFIAELKVGAIEQQLWDALKLATGLLTQLAHIRRAYLIAAADSGRFEAGQVSELFKRPIAQWRRHETTQLLKANQAAWRHDLKHGAGRPEWIPAEIFTSLLGAWEIERWGQQLRVVALEIADPEHVEMVDGCWPAVLGLESVAFEPPGASVATEVDTTTALPDFRSGKKTDIWLAARISEMPDDEYVSFCQYITKVKHWRSTEINERVKIHRRPAEDR